MESALMRCPFCNEEISVGAKKCKHCNEIINLETFCKTFISDKERLYYSMILIITVLFYLIMLISIVGIVWLACIALFLFIEQGVLIGHIQANAVKLNKEQFKDAYEMAEKLSLKLNLEKVPDIYVLQEGGILNALATKFLEKDFVVIYSDILELGYNGAEDALEYIICHELTHVKRKHVLKNIFLLPGLLTPFLGVAYSRACEYTCDSIAAKLCPKGALKGLSVLAVGKKLYKEIDHENFINTACKNTGFWSWLAEIISTHPSLYKRLKNVSSII